MVKKTLAKVSEKTVVVAGSDGDIGRAVVRLFSERGWAVAGLSRKAAHREGLALALTADLADADAVEKAADKIAAGNRRVRCLVNAAGFYRKTGESACDADVLRNNLGIAESLLKAFTPRLAGGDGARIVTIASIDHKIPNVNSFSYSVAKAGVKTLVELYRKRYRGSSVNFDLISPGAVNTRMRAGKTEDKGALVQPEDVARICLMLAESSPGAAFDDVVVYPKSFTFAP